LTRFAFVHYVTGSPVDSAAHVFLRPPHPSFHPWSWLNRARSPPLRALLLAGLAFGYSESVAAELKPSATAVARFRAEVQPILVKYCYDCHGDGMSKGQVSFDTEVSDEALVARAPLWFTALRNVRAGVMPPDDGPRPTREEVAQLERWIKYDAFGIDPHQPDPGRVTMRRLNRVEYRNTIRDLMGIDFNSEVEFPADDTGHGFDNNGDVLTVSPLHLEKYLQAAEAIVTVAVPTVARVMPVQTFSHSDFRTPQGGKPGELALDFAPGDAANPTQGTSRPNLHVHARVGGARFL
jgi:mono/diheme cytochrome c family protein